MYKNMTDTENKIEIQEQIVDWRTGNESFRTLYLTPEEYEAYKAIPRPKPKLNLNLDEIEEAREWANKLRNGEV